MTSSVAPAAGADATNPSVGGSGDLSERAFDPGSRQTAPRDSQRLIFLGEALRAGRHYCDLDLELAEGNPEIHGLLDRAYDRMLAVRPGCSREDFALFALSLLSDRFDDDMLGAQVRQGALRYLDDHRRHLAPDIAALKRTPRGDRPTASANGTAPEAGVSQDFASAFETLKPNLGVRTAVRDPAPDGPEVLRDEAPDAVEAELDVIRARREAALRRLKARSRLQRVLILATVVVVAAVGYGLLGFAAQVEL